MRALRLVRFDHIPHAAKGTDRKPILYVDHIEQHGERLFRVACREDLEGIVAKWKDGQYDPTRPTSWIKIKNAAYTQIVGRERLFEKRKPLATAIQGRNPKLDFRSKFLKSEVLVHEERLRRSETERA